MNPTVSILTPCVWGVMPYTYVSAISITAFSASQGVRFGKPITSERTPLHNARNEMTAKALSLDSEWSFWLDADVEAPDDALLRLIHTARKTESLFVTGITPRRRPPYDPLTQVKVDGQFHPAIANETFEVQRCGMTCALIHRRLFEHISQPWFLFTEETNAEDFYFCDKVVAAGYRIYADPEVKCIHYGLNQPITVDMFDKKKYCEVIE